MQQVSRSSFRDRLYSAEGTLASKPPTPTAHSRPVTTVSAASRKKNDFTDHRCPSVASYRGDSATRLPPLKKNVASAESQLSLPFTEAAPHGSQPRSDTVRHPIKRTDVTRHASEAIAVGHGNVFGKGASVTTKGWTRGKFV